MPVGRKRGFQWTSDTDRAGYWVLYTRFPWVVLGSSGFYWRDGFAEMGFYCRTRRFWWGFGGSEGSRGRPISIERHGAKVMEWEASGTSGRNRRWFGDGVGAQWAAPASRRRPPPSLQRRHTSSGRIKERRRWPRNPSSLTHLRSPFLPTSSFNNNEIRITFVKSRKTLLAFILLSLCTKTIGNCENA